MYFVSQQWSTIYTEQNKPVKNNVCDKVSTALCQKVKHLETKQWAIKWSLPLFPMRLNYWVYLFPVITALTKACNPIYLWSWFVYQAGAFSFFFCRQIQTVNLNSCMKTSEMLLTSYQEDCTVAPHIRVADQRNKKQVLSTIDRICFLSVLFWATLYISICQQHAAVNTWHSNQMHI